MTAQCQAQVQRFLLFIQPTINNADDYNIELHLQAKFHFQSRAKADRRVDMSESVGQV